MSNLTQFIQSNPHPKELKRALAVQMVLEQYSYREIQKVLQVSPSFISKWKQVYEKQGIEGLKLRYRGTQGYLKPQDKEEILKWLQSRQNCSLEEVIKYLECNYNIVFKSLQSYYELLRKAGLKWKKPESLYPTKKKLLPTAKNKGLWRQ